MSKLIIYTDTSDIIPGKFESLKTALKELVVFVEEHETRPLFYSFYFNTDNTRMTLVQIHPDSDSLEHHMQIAGSAFPKFSEHIRFIQIDIFGTPSEKLLQLLEKKTHMLGSGRVVVHNLSQGFTRLNK